MSYSKGAKIEFFTVRTPDDKEEFVITEQLGPIQFYEDMIDASFHVEVMVFDTAGKLHGIPIRSGSKVFFRIKTLSLLPLNNSLCCQLTICLDGIYCA